MYQPEGESYRPTRRVRAATVIGVVGALLAVVALAALASFVADYVRERDAVETALIGAERDSNSAQMLRSLRTELPEDRERFKKDMELLRREKGEAALKEAAPAWIKSFVTQNFDAVMRNELSVIRNIFDLDAEIAEAVAALGEHHCADHAMGRTPPALAAIDRRIASALDAKGAAIIRAIKSGRALPARTALVANEADQAAFAKALRSNASPAVIELIATPSRLAGASDTEKCQVMLALNDAVAIMPEPHASRLAGVILHGSMTPAPNVSR